MKKKLFFFVGVFVVCIAGTFFCLLPSLQKQSEKALLHFQQNNFSAMEEDLRSIPSPVYGALFRGYLEQAKGNFDLSESHLKAAIREAKRGGKDAIIAECLLLRASNAYLQGRDHDFYSLVDNARKCGATHPALTFFEGLDRYLQHEYAEALQLWGRYCPEECGQWMALTVERFFPLAWRKLHLAHCLIEKGEVLSAREVLEREGNQIAIEAERLALINLLKGLSYVKESHEVPMDQRDCYYELAHFYLERADVTDGFSREKNKVALHLEEEVKSLLVCNLDQTKWKWGLGFIRILDEWESKQCIERLANHLAHKLLHQRGQDSTRLCKKVREECNESYFHLLLTDRLVEFLTQELKAGHSDDLFELWALIEPLSPNPLLAAQQLGAMTAEEIFEAIKNDDLHLTQTHRFVAFWKKLDGSQPEKELLAHHLLFQAKILWQNEKQEKKGQHLMELALQTADYDPTIEKEIASFLTILYAQAENSNMIRRLTLVYEAMEHFDINCHDFISKSTVANHLADAEYLYKSHNYLATKIQATWVLKLDPNNLGARRLAGLSCFQLGEYHRALCHLRELNTPDEEASKALMVSKAYAAQEQGNHLYQIGSLDAFDEND